MISLADKLLGMPSKDVEKHVTSMVELISSSEKGPVSQKKLHMLHYAATLGGSNATVANLLVRRGILTGLARLAKEASVPDV